MEFPVPLFVSDARRFLGISGWFKELIEKYARLTVKLTDSLKSKNILLTKEMNEEFMNLKEVVYKLCKLQIANYEKEFLLQTDASNIGLEVVLLQRKSKKKWVLLQWASKKVTSTENNYGISEKEIDAVLEA